MPWRMLEATAMDRPATWDGEDEDVDEEEEHHEEEED